MTGSLGERSGAAAENRLVSRGQPRSSSTFLLCGRDRRPGAESVQVGADRDLSLPVVAVDGGRPFNVSRATSLTFTVPRAAKG